jgi:hypothetical protein
VSDVATPREVPPEEKYQESPPPKDPNMPVKPVDPDNADPADKIRVEGPEVADPVQQAAHDAYNEGTGALEAQATRLEAQAAIKRGEGDTEAAEKLEAEAATTREEIEKKRMEAAQARAPEAVPAEAGPKRSKSES